MTDITNMLRQIGLRVTQQRTATLSILAKCDDHPTVDDIHAKACLVDDTISIATIYRTLATLESAGLVTKLSFQDAPARYEMSPTEIHDHLVDIDTGEIIELPSDKIAALRSEIAAKCGYEIITQQTVVRGRRIKK